ncbi:MAG: arginase family protein [Candidatus Aminicenantes bacterium]
MRYRRGVAFLIIIPLFIALSTGSGITMIKKKDPIKLAIVLQPVSGSRSGPEMSTGPRIMYEGVTKMLAEMGIEEAVKETVKLTPEEEKDYGAWHRVGLANGHLNENIARLRKEGLFPLGLLSNCNSLLGMLAGMQHSGPGRRPLSVGLIWLDAHADYNTPETTLSGMLGGMPVAVAAGKCLFRLRLKAGLDPAIPEKNIIMMGVRDMDPLEEELVLDSHITLIPTEDIIELSPRMTEVFESLCDRVDVVYIHIDLDVLDAPDIPGHTFQIPNGPNPTQLGKALRYMMLNPKVGALGIASFPTQEDVRATSLRSTLEVIKGGLLGLQHR